MCFPTDASSDLIDLNSHPATPTTPAMRTDLHEYVNDSVVFQKGSLRGAIGGVPAAPPPMPLTSTQSSIQKDPFDMRMSFLLLYRHVDGLQENF